MSSGIVVFYILYILIKFARNDYKSVKANSLLKKPVKYNVNGKSIQYQGHLSYYWQLLNIPQKIEYIDDQFVDDCYRLSIESDKTIDPATILFVTNTQLLNQVQDKIIDPATVAYKQAARLYLLDRIHYMHSLN